MSWELMSQNKEKCKCGKGYLIINSYSDDWNRSKEEYIIDCEDCKSKYVIAVDHHTYKPYHGHDVIVWKEKETGEVK